MRVYCSKACQEYCPELNKLKECYDIVRNDLSRMTEERERLKVELEKQMNDERREQARLIDDRDLWKSRTNELADLVIKKEADRKDLAKTLASLANWNDSLRLTINDYLNERANKADLKLALTSWRENHAKD